MCDITCLIDITDPAKAIAEAEAIFWESAGTKRFRTDAERADYRHLWLGRYLDQAPAAFFLALGAGREVIGYLAGSLVSDAPALPGPDYYALLAPESIGRYPAHVHINVHADCRGTGVGARLMRAFADHCRANHVPGLHAVTAVGSRSAAFFGKCGLTPLADITWRDRNLVVLAAGFSDENTMI